MRALLGVPMVATLLLRPSHADACMCVQIPNANVLVTPDRLDDAPLDTHVRLMVADPSSLTATPTPPFGRVVLRVHGGPEVRTRTVSTTNMGASFRADVVPVVPLAPRTVYELATLQPTQTIVFGTFRTGTTKDTTAPKLEDPGKAWGPTPPPPSQRVVILSSSCDAEGPHLLLRGIAASDPGRPDAQLVALVWLPEPNGAFDTTKPPDTSRRITSRDVMIGKQDLCDTDALPMPGKPPVEVGVVVADEAGNRSGLARVPVLPGPPR